MKCRDISQVRLICYPKKHTFDIHFGFLKIHETMCKKFTFPQTSDKKWNTEITRGTDELLWYDYIWLFSGSKWCDINVAQIVCGHTEKLDHLNVDTVFDFVFEFLNTALTNIYCTTPNTRWFKPGQCFTPFMSLTNIFQCSAKKHMHQTNH